MTSADKHIPRRSGREFWGAFSLGISHIKVILLLQLVPSCSVIPVRGCCLTLGWQRHSGLPVCTPDALHIQAPPLPDTAIFNTQSLTLAEGKQGQSLHSKGNTTLNTLRGACEEGAAVFTLAIRFEHKERLFVARGGSWNPLSSAASCETDSCVDGVKWHGCVWGAGCFVFCWDISEAKHIVALS